MTFSHFVAWRSPTLHQLPAVCDEQQAPGLRVETPDAGDRWVSTVPLFRETVIEIFRDLILVVNKAVQDLSKRIEADAPKVLPKGMGRLTHENIETEVRDWNRLQTAAQSGVTQD